MVVRNINFQVLYSQTDFSGTAVLGWAQARQEALAVLQILICSHHESKVLGCMRLALSTRSACYFVKQTEAARNI